MRGSKLTGSRMKLTPMATPGAVAPVRTDAAQEAVRPGAAAASVVAPDNSGVGAQASLVQAAQAQVLAMPEVDAARVAEIKEALQRGDISFDPQKLAQLIMRHHGGRQ